MRHCALASIFVAALTAGDAPAPFAQLAMPDLVRTGERVAAGPYGKIWRLPAVQKLRSDLTALPGADAAWMAMIGQVREARCDLTLIPGKPGDSQARIALRVPAGHDPAALEEVALRREGEWLLVGKTDALGLPPVIPGDADSDLRWVINVESLMSTLPLDAVQPTRQVLAILGLSKLDASATAFPGGIREQMVVSGAKLPLKTIDSSALAGFPERPMGIMAVGVDGKALVRVVHEIAAAVGAERDLARFDAMAKQEISMGLDDMLGGFDGTIVFATTSGVPFPCFTLTLPGSKALDAVVTSVFEQMMPGTGAQTVAQARTQSVIVPTPPQMPISVSIRRTATRWLISTDQVLIESLVSDKAEKFPVERVWPKSAGAIGLLWNDNKAQMQMLVGLLPMIGANMTKDKDARRLFTSVQSALIAAIPYLLPSSMVARSEKEGLHIHGENGIVANFAGVSVLAGMTLPAITLVRENARRANAGNNMRQITIGMMVYGNENDGRWPADFAEVKKFHEGELSDKLFQSPGHPEIAEPFLYVRPDPAAKAIQPIIVQDPACNRGKGSMVCYGDGHVAFIKSPQAVTLWVEAKRLAALPKAAQGGIQMKDWTVPVEPVSESAGEVGKPLF